MNQLFKGMLYHCVGGDVSDVINKTDCLNKGPPFRWVNCKYNFDDLGQVSLVGPGQDLGVVSATAMWPPPIRGLQQPDGIDLRFTLTMMDYSAAQNI